MELKTTLNEEMTSRYETVKEHTGMKDDKSVLALLISREYSRIQRSKRHKLFLSRETYALATKAAEARGETIDEYVDELIEKKVTEGVNHGN